MHGYVLVYSITSRVSLEKLKCIHEKLLNMLGTEPPRILVASMSDLRSARYVLDRVDSHCSQVSVEEGEQLASQWNCPFLECSAKLNSNVIEVFTTLIKEIERDSGLLATQHNATCTIL